MLKIGNDHFEATHLEPKVDVCNRAYVFDAQPHPTSPNLLVFNPNGKCPTFVVDPKIALPAGKKQRADEVEYAQLLEDNVPTAQIYSGLDGGMNKVFLARFPGRCRWRECSHMHRTGRNVTLPRVDNDGSLASRLFGTLTDMDGIGHAGVPTTPGYFFPE